jgi:hypothetical protein
LRKVRLLCRDIVSIIRVIPVKTTWGRRIRRSPRLRPYRDATLGPGPIPELPRRSSSVTPASISSCRACPMHVTPTDCASHHASGGATSPDSRVQIHERFPAATVVYVPLSPSRRVSVRAGTNVPISVTIPTACALPRSRSWVTVAGLMSTQTTFVVEGRQLPTATE